MECYGGSHLGQPECFALLGFFPQNWYHWLWISKKLCWSLYGSRRTGRHLLSVLAVSLNLILFTIYVIQRNVSSCKKRSNILGCVYIFSTMALEWLSGKWMLTVLAGCSSTFFSLSSCLYVSLYLFNLSSLTRRVCFITRVLLEGSNPYPHISLNHICSYSR